ncbi:MAG: hypothetical protein FJ243_02505 [Nitrospira sp.]|nr:hypothetical protein [Nitrospira sp.]
MKNQIRYFQNLFYDLLNDYGRVYVVVKYSYRTTIGNRGFTGEEKEKGLVLVFNQMNYKNLQWTDEGSIVATLGFGVTNKPENCFLYFDDIVALYSPDAKVIFDRWDMEDFDRELATLKGSAEVKIIPLKPFRKIKTGGEHGHSTRRRATEEGSKMDIG